MIGTSLIQPGCRAILGSAILVAFLGALPADAQQPPPPQAPPRFRTTVEVTPIDVGVVDDRGRPIRDLAPGDFVVRIDGTLRKVVSAEWTSLVEESAEAASAPPVPEGYSSNEHTTGGRLIVLAIDQPNIRFGGAHAVSTAVSAFIDRLQSSDRIAVIGFGRGAPSTPFTADHEMVKQAVNRMEGQTQTRFGSNANVSVTEALAIDRGDPGMLDTVVARECVGLRGQALEFCRSEIQSTAQLLVQNVSEEGNTTIRGLSDVINGLKSINGAKTLILVSEGFIIPEAASTEVANIGAAAAAAHTSVYALKLDDHIYDASEARAPTSPTADRQERARGLDMLAGTARGALFNVTGTGAGVFERVEAELSGYYLLGLEADPRDRDGKPHPIRVEVPRKGATVRARRQMLNVAAEDAHAKSPREVVAEGLNTPLLMSALPIRIITFALQGPEQSKVQLLIHAEVGTDYSGPRRVSVGYMIADRFGHVLESRTSDARLAPLVNGVPSSLQYVGGASLEPGDYSLKFAVADGDKVGSVEHSIHAALVDAGALKLSELMIGGPVEPGDLLRPSIGYTISYGLVHGYLEAYGSNAPLKVKYEIATDETSPAILEADVPERRAGENRILFSNVLAVRALPPGKYLFRAVVSAGGSPVKTMSRAFEVAPPAVMMTSATGIGPAGGSPAAPDLFLPVDEEAFAVRFRREEALAPSVLQPFRERLASPAKPAFEEGLAHLQKGEYVAAEMTFKRTIQPDADSTAGLAYLAVCFAASGHDPEAANVWQTALIDGADLPQIYDWLGHALLRTRDLSGAQSVFEEAVGRWPADGRFARPLALLYATFGKGREAVRSLERYIGDGHADPDSLFLALQWLFQVHVNGQVVHNRAEDLKLVRTYSEQYIQANGPKQPLVKQWVDFIEHQK
jgi:VWFA-related protein